MLGNDLIYLPTQPKRDLERFKKYVSKTFTNKERVLILGARFSFIHHLLWSAKEAAYKAYIQVHPETEKFYAPKKFEVNLDTVTKTNASGMVSFERHNWFFVSTINASYVHTIAFVDEAFRTKVHVKIIEASKTAVRQMEIEALGTIVLQNNANGIPKPWFNKKQIDGYASVSHDGGLVAMVFLRKSNFI